MSKPWMKFYPADWQADPALRSCAITARGLWLEMLCIMQKSEPVGHLLVNGKSPSTRGLATLCGATEREVVRGLDELESAGVFSRLDDGTIFSRRMVRDERRAAEAKEIGARGGNPALRQGVNPRDKATDNGGDKAQKPEARIQKENARDARLSDEIIDRIWADAPPKARERSSKADVRRTLAAAVKRGGEVDEIMRALQAYWRSEDASKDGGAFAKGIHRMIEGDRWRDWASAPAGSATNPADEPINWAMRMTFWRKDGTWLGSWGPSPRYPNCECPAELLEAV